MAFITKRRRAPVIVLVSLIDVLVLLLIFFMVTTSFKMPQPEVQLKLPEAKHSKDGSAVKNEPLILTIDKSEKLYLRESPVTLKTLPALLAKEKGLNPDAVLELKSDEKASFGLIIKIMDIARDAKIENVKALTRQPEIENTALPAP